ncbi:GNAT superfamily N-acetyltransferase [Bradyrhizobium sp. USDA 4503]
MTAAPREHSLREPRKAPEVSFGRMAGPIRIRVAGPGDREDLQAYVRSLSGQSRYNRFLSALPELPASELERFVNASDGTGFTVVASMAVEGRETIVGEARYLFHVDTSSFECGLSIGDPWQQHGIGSTLVRNLEDRAASLGAVCTFGDSLRSNKALIGFARKCGYAVSASPIGVQLVRFKKRIDGLGEPAGSATELRGRTVRLR